MIFIFLTFLLLCGLLQCDWWESTVKRGSVAYAWHGPRFRIYKCFLRIRIRKPKLRMADLRRQSNTDLAGSGYNLDILAAIENLANRYSTIVNYLI
jgi:hypothetical protein